MQLATYTVNPSASLSYAPHSGASDGVLPAIISAVADEFGLTVTQLMAPTRSHAVWKPRMAAMYYGRTLTQCSLPELGQAFGGRSHTTVLRAVRRCQDMIKHDPHWAECMEGLLERLTRLVAQPQP
jgi:chromosomal replication initiator protein